MNQDNDEHPQHFVPYKNSGTKHLGIFMACMAIVLTLVLCIAAFSVNSNKNDVKFDITVVTIEGTTTYNNARSLWLPSSRSHRLSFITKENISTNMIPISFECKEIK